MAAAAGKGSTVEGNGTLHELTQMQERTAGQGLPAGPADRELTEQKQRQIVEGASKVLFAEGFHGTSIRDIARLRHVDGPALPLHLLQGRHPLPDAPAQPGAVAPAPGRGRLRCDRRPGRQAGTRPAHLHQVPVGEPGPDPFIYTESKYMDREHLREGLGARRQERGGLLPPPTRRDPGTALQGRRPSWPPTWSPSCASSCPPRLEPAYHRSRGRGRGGGLPGRLHLPRSRDRAHTQGSGGPAC